MNKKTTFKFNRDDSANNIYPELLLYARNNTTWTEADYNLFYDATKDGRDKLISKLEETFHVVWLDAPTARPKVTLKRDEETYDMFRKIYMLHDFNGRRYIKRKMKYAKNREEEIKIIEQYYDVRWKD